MSGYICFECTKTFTTKQNLKYHQNKKVCTNGTYKCQFCYRKFTTNNSMYRHMKYSCKVKLRNDEEKNAIFERTHKILKNDFKYAIKKLDLFK